MMGSGAQLEKKDIERILAWYQQQGTVYPWGGQPNAYQVWVSEVMLQQTTATAVIPYFERWMQQLPSPAAVAASSSDLLLRLWEGLGYYRRVHMLQAACQRLTREGLQQPPPDQRYLESLPGIGPYTSAAILSFAYHLPHAVYDTNVERLCRRLGAHYHFSAAERSHYQKLIKHWLELAGDSSRWNSAVMQLGQQICRPRHPLCPCCPLQHACQAHARDQVKSIPPARSKTLLTRQLQVAIIINPSNCILLQQRPSSRFAGLWCLPHWESEQAWPHLPLLQQAQRISQPPSRIEEERLRQLWPQICSERPLRLAQQRHLYQNNCDLLQPQIYLLTQEQAAPAQHQWCDWEQLQGCAMPSSYRRLLAQLVGDTPLGPAAKTNSKPYP